MGTEEWRGRAVFWPRKTATYEAWFLPGPYAAFARPPPMFAGLSPIGSATLRPPRPLANYPRQQRSPVPTLLSVSYSLTQDPTLTCVAGSVATCGRVSLCLPKLGECEVIVADGDAGWICSEEDVYFLCLRSNIAFASVYSVARSKLGVLSGEISLEPTYMMLTK